MSAIKDLPNSKDYGLGFNYSVWTAGTSVTLCNVNWNSDYRDIVRFNTPADLDAFLKTRSGPVVEISKLSYAKFGRPIRLDTPFHTVQDYNYIRVSNPMQPIVGDKPRVFYYFITDVVYVNPNCTEVYIQLDVWQTFGRTVVFGNCYIERGHIGIANEDAMYDNGRFHLTQPEGLDVGGEYLITDTWSRDIASARRDERLGYSILVTTTVALDAEPGTVDAPVFKTATGSAMENLPNGAETYVFTDSVHFMEFMSKWSDKPWITQGIVSILAIPFYANYGIEADIEIIDNVKIMRVKNGRLKTLKTVLKKNWRNSLNHDDRYAHLQKFKVYPYTVLEMTSYTGTPVIIKPESWAGDDAVVVESPHFAQPAPRIMFYPFRYNSSLADKSREDAFGVVYDGGEFLDMATGIVNLPTFSLVNNSYISYMASNQSGIAFQHQSADWTQQRALQGAQTSYDQATAGISTTNSLSQQSIANNSAQAQLAMEGQLMNGAVGAVGGAIGARTPAGAAGAIAGHAANTAIGLRQTAQGLANQNAYQSGTNRTITGNMGYMRDTNKSLSEFAANGDYSNTIAGINAKVQDAKLAQPTTSGQMGGDAFNLAQYKWGYDIKVKELQGAARHAIGEYWLRYGYAVNRFGRLPGDLHAMEKFTYWRLKETYIVKANCPEPIKQIIRGIFEKGVTVWRNPEDMGTIDIADNAPLTGLRI